VKNRSPAEVIDEYLVLRGQAGDPEAFRRLVERWQPRFLSHAFRYTRNADAARDVAQESWLAIIKGISGLDDAARFRAWAYRIVANKARDWVRSERSRRRADAGAATPEGAALDGPPPHGVVGPIGSKRDAARIRECVARLEPEQRLVVTWFYLEDMSLRDIAEALSIPMGTVKSRLFHARAALRASLMEEV
jgi:RNA polymerase sigma-70 factor (ECF subfamily)